MVLLLIMVGTPLTIVLSSVKKGEFVDTQTTPTVVVNPTKPVENKSGFKIPTNQSKQSVVIKEQNNQPLFYPVYDKSTGKTIKVQAAIVVPPNFDPSTYNKPIVVLGHDGFDTKSAPVWGDPTLKTYNSMVKNTIRIGTDIANQGSLVIVPAYRGESLSEGNKSLIAYDVMDNIAAIRFIKSALPTTNTSVINLAGTSRGALVSVLTAQVYPVNKVVEGFGVMNFRKWISDEAGGSNKEYPDIQSWDQILDDEAIKVATEAHGGKLPPFTRTAIDIGKYANPNTSFYISQGALDKDVKLYNATEFQSRLKQLGIPHAMDIYYGTHKEPSDGTHGFLTREPKYNDSKKGLGLTAMKTKFVAEATSVSRSGGK
jgi:hypothetical protein